MAEPVDRIAIANLARLCAIAIRPNSVFTFSIPLKQTFLNFLFCFMFPNIGSTSIDRFLR